MDGSNFSEQLRMFVSAHEAAGYHFMDRGGSKAAVMRRKIAEASEQAKYNSLPGGSLTAAIAQEGVKTPIHVYHSEGDATAYGVHGPALFDGHHRVAVANEQDPDQLVPVVHDSKEAAQYRRGAEVAAYKRNEAAKFEARRKIREGTERRVAEYYA